MAVSVSEASLAFRVWGKAFIPSSQGRNKARAVTCKTRRQSGKVFQLPVVCGGKDTESLCLGQTSQVSDYSRPWTTETDKKKKKT